MHVVSGRQRLSRARRHGAQAALLVTVVGFFAAVMVRGYSVAVAAVAAIVAGALVGVTISRGRS
jgi:hypothetical protein